MKINGYDFDGVVSLGIKPSKNDIIITGRSYEEKPETRKFLEKNGIDSLVWYNGIPFEQKTRATSGQHKAEVIKMLYRMNMEVVNFFEDDPIQARIIRKECPDVNVVLLTPSKRTSTLENVRRDQYNNEI